MGPQLALLVGALVGCLLPARGCILCDPKVELALNSLEKDYLPTHIGRGRQQEVMKKIRQTLENFKDLPDLKPTYDRIVDDVTMRMASTSFLRSLKMITNRGLTGDTFLKEFSKMLTREKESFWRNVTRFLKPGFCPNKCGRLLQLLRYCDNCTMHTKSCPKSTDCGVRRISVYEKDDMNLDCQLDWHTIAEGVTNYSFYRVWGSNSETLMYQGKRPALAKPLVRREDAGNYRCELGTERSGPVSIIRFEVTVLPQRIIVQPMSKSSTFVTRTSTTGTKSLSIETQSPTIGMSSPAIVTEAEEEIGDDLSPAQEPSECPKPKNVQRNRLIGLLIWCFFLLILGFVTGVLCFQSEKVLEFLNSWGHTDKAAAPPDEVSESRLSQSPLPQDKVSQSQPPRSPLPQDKVSQSQPPRSPLPQGKVSQSQPPQSQVPKVSKVPKEKSTRRKPK
ncbi:izumo sperm-egg fusion protein 1-like isoform X1 [Crocuta crocuta]